MEQELDSGSKKPTRSFKELTSAVRGMLDNPADLLEHIEEWLVDETFVDLGAEVSEEEGREIMVMRFAPNTETRGLNPEVIVFGQPGDEINDPDGFLTVKLITPADPDDDPTLVQITLTLYTTQGPYKKEVYNYIPTEDGQSYEIEATEYDIDTIE